MPLATFRERPAQIQAIQLCWANWPDIQTILDTALNDHNPDGARSITADQASDTCGETGPYLAINLCTSTGSMAMARHGDWIIAEPEPGRYRACPPDHFADAWEPIA